MASIDGPTHHKPKNSVAFAEEPEEHKATSHRGISALILAATSQLGPLAEAATLCSDMSDLSTIQSHHDGYASSNEGEGLSTSPALSARTPILKPEEGIGASQFLERLMSVLKDPSNVDAMTFLPDGKFFAIRTSSFMQDSVASRLGVSSLSEFLDLLGHWGFSRIDGSDDEVGQASSDSPETGEILVYRHPLFYRGSLEYGKMSLDTVKLHEKADPAVIEMTASDDSMASCSGASDGVSKRRLSPSHLRRLSESSESTVKKRHGDSGNASGSRRASLESTSIARRGSLDTCASAARRRASNESRSVALAITTSRLQLDVDTRSQDGPKPLVDGAVESATRNIVVGAIETLLWDEEHTRETYRKHATELSQSSIPGVVPISRQLFSPGSERRTSQAGSTQVPASK